MSGLKVPRRKRRVYQQLDSPFPVPIESVTKKAAADSRWFYYTALLKENSVLVQQEGDAIFLYKMGFFGKGLLSKSKPEHNVFLNSYQGLHKKNLPPKERRFQQQRFQQVRKNRYERHLSWLMQFVRQCRNAAGFDAESGHVRTETDDITVEMSDVTTKTNDVTTRTDDVTSGTDDVTAGIDDVTTRTDDVATGTDDVTTGTDDVTTRTDDVTTRTDDVTTRTDDVTTGTDDVTTRTDDVTTRTDDVTTRTDDVTTGTDDVKMEDQCLVRKEDPYQIHEYLLLKLEEAFFLSYGLGCLTVLDENKKPLDLTEMWQAFCARQENFVASYIAYHYYRSKGWVPRDGVKYGAHYILYKHGPPFYHGSYSVIVKMVTEGSQDVSPTDSTLTWPALSGMDRITETVAKEVMLCYVLRPADLSDAELDSPSCIPRFRVQELVIKRWVSSRERELKDQPSSLIS